MLLNLIQRRQEFKRPYENTVSLHIQCTPKLGGLSIGSNATLSNAKVKILGGTSVKLSTFTIGLGTSNTITGAFFGNRAISGTFGLSAVVTSTSELSSSTAAQGTFSGNSGDTINGTNLNLGTITAKAGGANASLIHTLTKIEIRGLTITTSSGTELHVGSALTTITSMDITLVFSTPVSATNDGGNRQLTLNGQGGSDTPIAGVTPTISAATFSSSGGTVKIDAYGNVSISTAIQLDTLTIDNATGATQGKSGTATGTDHKIILHGSTSQKQPVQSLPVTTTNAANSNITLAKDSTSGGTLKLAASTGNPNLDLNVSETASSQGKDKAGSFTRSSQSTDKLKKMEITLALNTTSGNATIDGVDVGNKVKLTLVCTGSGTSGSGTGFSVRKSDVDQPKSSFAFPDAPPPDFVYGPTFGTVSFNFSLFHLTGSLFTTQAYSVGIGSFKCAVDSGCAWPTRGIGGFRSFFWWLNYGLKNGNRRFWSLADVDIISVIS